MAEKTLRLFFENSTDSEKTVFINIPLADDQKMPIEVKPVMEVIYAKRDIFNLDIGPISKAGFVNPQTIQYLTLPA